MDASYTAQVILLLGTVYFAFSRNEFLFYVIATFMLIFLGIHWGETLLGVGVIVILAGVYTGFKAVLLLVGR